MGALREQVFFYTVDEYLAFENHADTRHEYLHGEIHAMAGTTPRYNAISLNVALSLHSQLRGRPCSIRAMDQRLRVEAADLITYPDVLVVCPPEHYSESDHIALIDASVVIEVLSPSTARYDRSTKFDAYKLLPSLSHYLLIEQSRIEVEHYFQVDGQWHSEIFAGLNDQIRLDAINCILRLGELYEAIEF